MREKETKFYRKNGLYDEEVNDIAQADYAITKILMTPKEFEEWKASREKLLQ